MLEKLTGAWRARRVLLIGGPDAQNLYTQALLGALGARCARIPPDADAHTLNRAMQQGRVSAVIVPSVHALRETDDLFDHLHALDLIFCETREAGIPLCILCSHADVYADGSAWPVQENALVGGRTREGLIQSILQLYADGVSRALMGDAVASLICRHAPCLGSNHESVAQYAAWCRAILRDEQPTIEHPGAQGVFFHPLDAALGALCLGAAYFEGNSSCTGCFNIAPAAENLCANRSVYAFLAAQTGASRAAAEAYPPRMPSPAALCGAKLKQLCGYAPVLTAKDALSFFMEHERARAVSEAAAELKRQEQAESFLEKMK